MSTWPARSCREKEARVVSVQPAGGVGDPDGVGDADGVCTGNTGTDGMTGIDGKARGGGAGSATARLITTPAITIRRTIPALNHRTLLVIAAKATAGGV
jgi:hypothetical protein